MLPDRFQPSHLPLAPGQSVISRQSLVISRQSSVVSHQPASIGNQSSSTSHQSAHLALASRHKLMHSYAHQVLLRVLSPHRLLPLLLLLGGGQPLAAPHSIIRRVDLILWDLKVELAPPTEQTSSALPLRRRGPNARCACEVCMRGACEVCMRGVCEVCMRGACEVYARCMRGACEVCMRGVYARCMRGVHARCACEVCMRGVCEVCMRGVCEVCARFMRCEPQPVQGICRICVVTRDPPTWGSYSQLRSS